MADDGDPNPREFPDVSHKLAAPKKLSAFEQARLAGEKKKKRDADENAAALKDFEASFGDIEEEEYKRLDAIGLGWLTDGRHRPRGGWDGQLTSDRILRSYVPRGYAPGEFVPPNKRPGGSGNLEPLPPVLKRKRALDEMREAEQAKRTAAVRNAALKGGYVSSGPGIGTRRYSAYHDDDDEELAPRPTVRLTFLPPSMTEGDVRALLQPFLPVHRVTFEPSLSPAYNVERSMSAIATLSIDTSTSQIDAATSALKDKYLGKGFYLSISRHLSSTSLLPALSYAPSGLPPEPFNAQIPNKEQPRGGYTMRTAPPPSDFATPGSYNTPRRPADYTTPFVEVHPPSDISIVRAIHVLVERLLSEPNPARALQIEAMLMKQPEVQIDERFAFLYDSKSSAGVYYRFLLWTDDDPFDAIQDRNPQGSERIFDDHRVDWIAPSKEVPFADLSSLAEVLDHPNYQSDHGESDDGEEERQLNNNRKEGEGNRGALEMNHLTPLQVAKLAWLLSRVPSNHATLKKGNVAPITSFAIYHAAVGAEEIVEMMVLNVDKPFTRTQCAKFDNGCTAHDDDDDEEYEPNQELPTIISMPEGEKKKEAGDISAAKYVALLLINDILHNSSTAGVRNVWKYRTLFESAFRRQKTFERLGRLDRELGWGRIRAERWKRQIGRLFDIWEARIIFSSDVSAVLRKSFYDQPRSRPGSSDKEKPKESVPAQSAQNKWKSRFKPVSGSRSTATSESPAPMTAGQSEAATSEADLDGAPMEDIDCAPMGDLDGTPMDDIDGTPMDGIDGAPITDKDSRPSRRKKRMVAEDMFGDDFD